MPTSINLLKEKTPEEALLRIVNDPVLFSRLILGHKNTRIQEQIMRAVANNRQVAVKGCHKSGKTHLASDLVLWWLLRYTDGMVITTAPTWTQVHDVMWKQIHQTLQEANLGFRPDQINETEIKLGPKNFAIGRSTDRGVRLQGYGGRTLIIVDEAIGIKEDIWQAIRGIQAGGEVTLLIMFNPTSTSGTAYNAFNKNRDQWVTFTISAFDTPNLEGYTLPKLLEASSSELNINKHEGFVTKSWVKGMYQEFGPDSFMWEARVMGEFPRDSAAVLIESSWLERSGESVSDAGGVVYAGLDVAASDTGDETCLVIREGGKIIGLHAWKMKDCRGVVAAKLREYEGRLQGVFVDEIGVGMFITPHLRDLGFPAIAINVAEAADNKERFLNKKVELYFRLRKLFQEGRIKGVVDPLLKEQLRTLRFHARPSDGRLFMESKMDLADSPDRAEAVMLSFARGALDQQSAAELMDLEITDAPLTANLMDKRF